MTITISPSLEALLRAKAQRDGQDIDAVAEALLAEALEWEARDRAEALEGIRRGLAASDAQRVRPFDDFAAEMRSRYPLPTHLSDHELNAPE